MSPDRETVANLFHNYLGYGPITADGGADIAIAYADRRVAEAVAECIRLAEKHKYGGPIAHEIAHTFRALSPALKPNRQEPTSEDAHWRDEYPMKYEPSMEEKAVARYWKLKEGGQGDENG